MVADMARRRLLALGALAMALTAAAGLGTAATASAATTCKAYDSYTTAAGGHVPNVRVCAAPATDFPTYAGWGQLVTSFVAGPSPCYGLLPYDIDEPQPAIGCLAGAPAVTAYRLVGRSWQATSMPLGVAYLSPYAPGWYWAWTQETGWLAVESSHAAYRWYA